MNDPMNGGSPSVLRGLNLRATLRHIRDSGPSTKADLIRLTGLSRPTINEVVADLLGTGHVTSTSEAGSAGANSRVRYSFNAARGCLVGIDVGSRKTIVLVSGLDGRVLARSRMTTDPTSTAPLDEALRTLITDTLEQAGQRSTDVVHATICVPGNVDQETGRLTLAPQLPGWNNKAIGGLLGLDCPTTIENEMRAALVGEHWAGAAKPYRNSVYVGIGEGVGSALMVHGEVFGGQNGAAGEIGYLSPNGPLVRPLLGELGPLERSAGASALTARAATVIEAHPGSVLAAHAAGAGGISPKAISTAAAAGDALAIGLLDDEAAILAQAISILTIILDPEAVIIGGGVAQAGALLRDPLQSRVNDLVPGRPPMIIEGALGDEAAAIGAIRIAVAGSDATIEQELRGIR
ncbi:ROK family transcriptional regulator [Microbacterium sp.]|uniref:ROK family transcriptional regulator n=1 Tax=Microbacterium sp. TaxID=51671 RepID=UPI003F996E0A